MHPHPPTQAALLAIASSAILSFIDNYVSVIAQEAGLWQFQMFRTLFALPLIYCFARFMGVTIWPKQMRRTLLRTAAVAIGLLVYFSALGILPVAQAGAGLFSAPVWVLMLSIAFFRSRANGWQILAVALGFGGVLMVLQPGLENFSWLSLYPLIAGIFYALGMLLTRHWCAEESPVALVFLIFLMMGVVSALILGLFTLWPASGKAAGFVIRGWVPPSPLFMWLTLAQAVGAIAAVSLITLAYRIGDPSFTAVYEYSFLIFAGLWSYALWDQTTNLLGWLGIGVILLSGTTAAWISQRRLPALEFHPVRRELSQRRPPKAQNG